MPSGEARSAAWWWGRLKSGLRSRWIRGFVSLALLAIVFHKIDLTAFVALSHDLEALPTFSAFVVGLTLMITTAFRWYILTGSVIGAQFLVFLRLTFVSAFIGLFLPGTVGAEAVRVLGLVQSGAKPAPATASIVVDRVLSLFAQFTLALALLAAAPEGFLLDLSVWAGSGVLLISLAAAAVMNRQVRDLIKRLLATLLPQRVCGPVATMLNAFEPYSDGRRMSLVVLLAFLFQVHRAIFLWTCAAAFGIDVSIADLLIALPVVTIFELAPLTLAGVGTREAGFAVVLGAFGVEPAEAVAMSLLAFLLGTVLASLPGAWLFAYHDADRPT